MIPIMFTSPLFPNPEDPPPFEPKLFVRNLAVNDGILIFGLFKYRI